ncbi:MAG TPA: histidinol-phosphate transaminase [Armatimonadota bacterium]
MQRLPYAREAIYRIRPYRPGKPLEEVEREYGIRDAVKMASNENPLGPSPAAVAAIQEHAGKMALYPEDTCFYLKRDLAASLGVPEEWLLLGNGSDEVLHCAALAFLSEGDEVVTGDPTFVMYETNAHLCGAVPVAVPLKDHKHDLSAMLAEVTDRTKLFVICNPNNPTGSIVSRSEVDEALRSLPSHVMVVLDEAYYEYAESPHYPQSIDYVREGRNVLVMRTFSKIHALAGLRIGYGIARPDIIQALQQVRPPFNVNSLAQVAARASLADPEQVRRGQAVNGEGKRLLYAAFDRMGLSYVPTEANFIFVDTRRDSKQVFEGLLRRGVVVRTGDVFGTPTYIRVTIGTPEQNQRFAQALEEVLKG